jgi:hypothetical protein
MAGLLVRTSSASIGKLHPHMRIPHTDVPSTCMCVTKIKQYLGYILSRPDRSSLLPLDRPTKWRRPSHLLRLRRLLHCAPCPLESHSLALLLLHRIPYPTQHSTLLPHARPPGSSGLVLSERTRRPARDSRPIREDTTTRARFAPK